jgi:hypothetical protein
MSLEEIRNINQVFNSIKSINSTNFILILNWRGIIYEIMEFN